MSDIVERLRGVAHTYDEHGVHSEIELEAAKEIERLRKNFSMAEHEMKIADRNRIFFQKEYERWMNISQELNDYTIKLEEAIFNYVNRVVSCEGVTFIDGLDDEWTSLICDVWTKQRKKVGDEDE